MTSERRFGQDSHVIDPSEFLLRPAWHPGLGELEIGRLSVQPNIRLLKLLPGLKSDGNTVEVGIVRRQGLWFMFQVEDFYLRREFTPDDADIWLHSHPAWENAPSDALDRSLPSTADFAYCLETAKNFIVSEKGIAQYWPVVREGKRLERVDLNTIIRSMNTGDTNGEYLRFLREAGARFILYPWQELTDDKLTELFQ